MRILISFFRRLTNVFGVQFLSLTTYKKLLSYQDAMTRLGIQPNQLEEFMKVDPADNVRLQTEKYAALASPNNNYFKALNKTLQEDKVALPHTGDGNLKDARLTQYNEVLIAQMLLKEKLTTIELSKTSKNKTNKRKIPSARAST